MPSIQLTEIQTAACIVFLVLAPLAGAGLALINAGLGRSRNAAHSMMAALCVISVAACMYFLCGRAFQGYAGGLAHVMTVGKKPWDWLGSEPWFFSGMSKDVPAIFLFAWFGIVAVGLAGIIPLGSGADRWRLAAICASNALLAGLTFPLFAHWAWGGRLSRPTGFELRAGPRLSGCRGRRSDPRSGGLDSSRGHVDRGTAAGQV